MCPYHALCYIKFELLAKLKHETIKETKPKAHWLHGLKKISKKRKKSQLVTKMYKWLVLTHSITAVHCENLTQSYKSTLFCEQYSMCKLWKLLSWVCNCKRPAPRTINKLKFKYIVFHSFVHYRKINGIHGGFRSDDSFYLILHYIVRVLVLKVILCMTVRENKVLYYITSYIFLDNFCTIYYLFFQIMAILYPNFPFLIFLSFY